MTIKANRTAIVTMRLTPETQRAATLVAAVQTRTLSSLLEHALRLYIEKNYPTAMEPGAAVRLSLLEAPSDTPPVDVAKRRNQCDGCQAGMPINDFGNHTADGKPNMACEKDKYGPEK